MADKSEHACSEIHCMTLIFGQCPQTYYTLLFLPIDNHQYKKTQIKIHLFSSFDSSTFLSSSLL